MKRKIADVVLWPFTTINS